MKVALTVNVYIAIDMSDPSLLKLPYSAIY